MKMCLSGLIVLIIIISFASSCQREIDIQNRTQSDSIYLLTQVTYLDTTFPSGADTASKTLFYYDSEKRLVRATVFANGLGTTRPKPYAEIRENDIIYNADDTVCKRFTNKTWYDYYTYGSTNPDRIDTVFLFYSNGEVIKDSVVGYSVIDDKKVTHFNKISSSKYQVIQKTVHALGFYTDTFSITYPAFTKANSNLSVFKDTSNLLGYPIYRNWDFSYDDKTNPYKRISIPYPFDINIDFFYNTYLPFFFTENNTNNKVIINDLNAATSVIYNYEYSSYGLPLIQRNNRGPQKILFEYKRQ